MRGSYTVVYEILCSLLASCKASDKMPGYEDDCVLTDEDAWRRMDASTRRQQRLVEKSSRVSSCRIVQTDSLKVSTISCDPQFPALCVTAYE